VGGPVVLWGVVSGEMLGEVLVHLEHAHCALAPEDGLELLIGQDLPLVLRMINSRPSSPRV
jgi:hypothetical protein